MQPSPLFSLNVKDFLKGLIVATGTAAITALQTTFQAGSVAINWKSTATVAMAAGLSYLLKNFFTQGPNDNKQAPANTKQTLQNL